MISSLRNTATVGHVSRKILELNPELGVQEVIFIIKQSVIRESEIEGSFTKTEYIDEAKALQMAHPSNWTPVN